MQSTEKKIWFPAKRYGWGWGPPKCWQGWVVMAVWLLFVLAGVVFLQLNHPLLYLLYLAVLVSALIIVCYLKGEKPRWRWGKD
jgi:hypothetical protein